MVKPSWYSEKRYNTPRECIEAQLKENEITTCAYYFDNKGGCWTQIMEAIDATKVTPDEMLDIAVKRFEEYGEVRFEGYGKYGLEVMGCWDENAFGSKY
jgi:hypothetical protein